MIDTQDVQNPDEIEFLYVREEINKKPQKFISAIKDNLGVWDIHSVRKEFPVYKIKISQLNEEEYMQELKLADDVPENVQNLEVEFSALPINHYILVGKKRGNTNDVS